MSSTVYNVTGDWGAGRGGGWDRGSDSGEGSSVLAGDTGHTNVRFFQIPNF